MKAAVANCVPPKISWVVEQVPSASSTLMALEITPAPRRAASRPATSRSS